MSNSSLRYRKRSDTRWPFLNADIAFIGLFVLEVFPLVIPEGLSTLYPDAYLIVYKYLRIISYAIILIHLLISLNSGKKVTPVFIAGIMFILLSVVIVFAYSLNLAGWLSAFGPCFFGLLLVLIYRNHLGRLILGLLAINEFWIYVNLLSMLAFPDGMYVSENTGYSDNWVLGYKSSLQYFILPALCFSLINLEYRGQKARTVLLVSACFFEAIYAGNAMLIVSLAILIALYFVQLRNDSVVFNARNYLIVVVAVNLVLVFFSSWFLASDFGQFFLNTLGKSSTLSSRASVIWPETLAAISDSLWLGYGIEDRASRVYMYHGIAGAIHAHNQLLEFAYIGGCALLAGFVCLLAVVAHRLMSFSSLESSKVLSVSIFAFLIALTVEVFTRDLGTSLWVMLFLGGMCEQVDAQLSICARGVWQAARNGMTCIRD